MDIVEESIPQFAGPALGPAHDPLARSLIGALAYADLFDYPLTVEEMARFQIETAFSAEKLADCLTSSYNLQSVVTRKGDFVCLRGREVVFETRRMRGRASRRIWNRAKLYAKWLARLPYVRMVAITGALAVDNIGDRPDIDLLIVTTEGRVWIARRLLIGMVRLARLFGDELCPNYIISQKNLNLEQQDLFTAHELAQMVPLYGEQSYRDMMAQNEWAASYLPVAFSSLPRDVPVAKQGLFRRLFERLLSLRVFDRWERWEQNRLQRKLRPLVGDAAEVICSPQQCKGHTGLHRQWVTSRYAERLLELGF